MKILRDGAVVGWALVLIALALLLLLSAGFGSRGTEAAASLTAVPAQQSSASDTIEALRMLSASGIAAGNDTDAVTAWAATIRRGLDTAHAARTSEQPGDSDPLLRAIVDAQAAADRCVAAADATTAAAARTHLLLALDALQYTARTGIHLDLPQAPQDRLSGPTEPAQPSASSPGPVPTPTIDRSGERS